MIVAVVGSRSFNDPSLLAKTLDRIKPDMIVSGGAIGADSMAKDYAIDKGIEWDEIKPDYKKYPRRAAPVIRNQLIVDAADKVVAFWDGKSPGTKDAIFKADSSGKVVNIVGYEVDPFFGRVSETKSLEVLAGSAKPGEMKAMREMKKRMMHGEVGPGEFESFVRGLYARIRESVLALPRLSNLIQMPSTTGRNIIPIMLFGMAQEDRPDLVLRNFADPFILQKSRLESKTKDRYDKRLADQKDFTVLEGKDSGALKGAKNNFILDDVISTGDTAFLLARVLESAGISVQGVLAGKANNMRLASGKDLQRLFNYVYAIQPKKYSNDPSSLKKDIFDNFAGFPRRKLTNFEIDARRNPYLRKPGFTLRFLSASADALRLKGLSASQLMKSQSDCGLRPSR
mgnify:CR=1 FL=1